MATVLSVLILIVCILLILIVLVQNSKGGGLSSSFASNNQIMGVRKTADFLEKATWGFAIALFLFSLLSTPRRSAGGEEQNTDPSKTRQIQDRTVLPANIPAAPNGVQPASQTPVPATAPGQNNAAGNTTKPPKP